MAGQKDGRGRRVPESTMSAVVVANTAAYAVVRGVPMERITEVTGLTLADLVDPDARLPNHHVPAIWRLLAEALPGSAVALEMAHAVPDSFFGPLRWVLRQASDLRAALEAFARYRRVLSTDLHAALVEEPPLVRFEVSHPMDAEDGGLAAEAGLALAVRFIRERTESNGGLVGVDLAHGPSGSPGEYEAFFQVPVRFHQPRCALLFQQAGMDRPLPVGDPQQFLFIQSHLDATLQRLAGEEDQGALGRVRGAAAQLATQGEYSAQALAEETGMSLRSLQRLTQAEGTSVRELLEETREAHARQLLTDDRLSVDEVAFLLGYSAESAFRRAFHRWTGRSPAQWRRETRRSPAHADLA